MFRIKLLQANSRNTSDLIRRSPRHVMDINTLNTTVTVRNDPMLIIVADNLRTRTDEEFKEGSRARYTSAEDSRHYIMARYTCYCLVYGPGLPWIIPVKRVSSVPRSLCLERRSYHQRIQ